MSKLITEKLRKLKNMGKQENQESTENLNEFEDLTIEPTYRPIPKSRSNRPSRSVSFLDLKQAKTYSESDFITISRWVEKVWLEYKVIPFELLQLDAFMITYYDIDSSTLRTIPQHKRKDYQLLHYQVLCYVAKLTGSSIFTPNNLSGFLKMCKRTFAKQQMYNTYVTEMITSPITQQAGYFIDDLVLESLRISRKKHNVKIVDRRTQIHTISTWLKSGKLVHVPSDQQERISLDDNFDRYTLDDITDMPKYDLGYGHFKYTSIEPNILNTLTDSELKWFIALNQKVPTMQVGLESPISCHDGHTPHSGTIEYTIDNVRTRLGIIIDVSDTFYDQYASRARMVNIRVTNEEVFINHQSLEMSEDEIYEFKHSLLSGISRMSGRQISLTDDYPILLSISKQIINPAIFTRNMLQRKRDMEDKVTTRIFKIINVASKASGKTTLINSIIKNLPYGVFIEDSDDYGKFLTWFSSNHDNESIVELDKQVSEIEVVHAAEQFAQLMSDKLIDNVPSHLNCAIKGMIEYHLSETKKSIDDLITVNQSTTNMFYSIDKIYKAIYPSINAYYTKLTGLKRINQKYFQDGLHRHMGKLGLKVHFAFLHLLLDNYARTPADIAMRYSPNIDPSVTIFERAAAQEMSKLDMMTDLLLKMFYDQSAESVTPIIGPTALMQMFGIRPVLTKERILLFRLE